MKGRHATSGEIERYVLGVLDPASLEGFESHCSACDDCAAALACEASLEMTFERVADRVARSTSPSQPDAPAGRRLGGGRATVQRLRPLGAAAFGLAGLVAAAAAAVLWLGRLGAGAPSGTAMASGASSRAADDAAILDARSDVLDGG